MKRILHSAALGLVVAAAGCATALPGETAERRSIGFDDFGRRKPDESLQTGIPYLRRGVVAKVDDTTNGADDKSGWAASAGSGTESGFFYDDGADGDIRGRVENFFTAPVAKPQAPTNVVAPPLPTPNAIARKMIYSASYAVMVSVVGEAIQKLTTRVTELGGYLSQRDNATLTVRVPAAKFSSFIAEIPALGRVIAESMKANDVTNQHTDLTIRLENAEKSRQRLLVLIEKATKMEDIIKIEAALRRLTGEIERMKGQLKLMNDQVAYSTVTVSFQANAPKAKATKRRQQSRFPWINRIGIEQDLRRF